MRRPVPVHAGPRTDLAAYAAGYVRSLDVVLGRLSSGIEVLAAPQGDGTVQIGFRRHGEQLAISHSLSVGVHEAPGIMGSYPDKRTRFGTVADASPEAYARSMAEILDAFAAHADGMPLAGRPAKSTGGTDIPPLRRLPPGAAAEFAPVAAALEEVLCAKGVPLDRILAAVRRDTDTGADTTEACIRLQDGTYLPWIVTLQRSLGIVVSTEVDGPDGKARRWIISGTREAEAASDTARFLAAMKALGTDVPGPAPAGPRM